VNFFGRRVVFFFFGKNTTKSSLTAEEAIRAVSLDLAPQLLSYKKAALRRL
jgi:hypothetical protein